MKVSKNAIQIKNKLFNTFIVLILLITFFSPIISIIKAEQNPPSNFNAEPLSRFEIALSWTNNENNITYIEWNTLQTWNIFQGFTLYTGTDTIINHPNLSPGTTYYYQAWSYNESNNTYSSNYLEAYATTFPNQAPSQKNENPTDNLMDVSITQPTVSVTIEDDEGDLFNWTIQGQYITDSFSNDDSNGTKSASLITPLPYDTTIIWYVNATDGIDWTNETYSFTTRGQYTPDTPSDFTAYAANRFKIDLTWTLGNKADMTYICYAEGDGPPADRDSGIFLYNDTGTSASATGLDYGTLYSFSAWSWNATDNVWSDRVTDTATTVANQVPVFDEVLPANNSIDQELSFTWQLRIRDLDANPFDWTIECSNAQSSGDTDDTDGVKTLVLSDLDYDKEYTVWVNATDGYDWNNETFSFRTRSQYVPAVPGSFAATKYNRTRIDLTWTIAEKADSTYIEYNSLESWAKGQGTTLYNLSGNAFSHNNLEFNTQYFYQAWSWNNTDKTWSATSSSTNATTDPNNAPTVTGENPVDGSMGLNPLPVLNVTIHDSDKDILDVFWYSNSTGPLLLFAADLNVDTSLGPVVISKTNANFSNYSTKYWWSVHCFDGTEWTNKTYSFTTRHKHVPEPPSNFKATTYSSNQINLTWVKGSNADYTRIQRKTESFPNSISDGTNVYDNIGSSFEDFIGISEGTTYYYSAWSYNVTDDAWSLAYASAFNTTNNKPVISNPVPGIGSIGVVVLPQLKITVNDVDGDLMTINWYSNSSGDWILFKTNTSVINGTYNQINSNFSQHGTKYWWYVAVSDGKDTKTSDYFYFTTNNKPTISNPVPANQSTNINPIPQLSITVDEKDFDLLDIKWYSNSSGPWTLFGSNLNVIKGTYQKINTNFSEYEKTYWWYVTVDDGKDVTISEIYHFTIRPQYIASPPSSFTATKYNRTRINLAWTIGEKADSTYIEWNTVESWVRGEGSFLFNGSENAYSHDDLEFNTQYFYQAWSWNNTDKIWSIGFSSASATTDPNIAPTISDELPVNNSQNVLANPMLYVTVDDFEDDSLDVFWYSNVTGSWVLFAVDLSVDTSSGAVSLSQKNENFNDYSTKYWWSVHCFDGTDWTNETYSFTRSPNNPPLIMNPYPADGATDIEPMPICNVTVDDLNEDTLTVSIYENTTRISDTLSYQISHDVDDAWLYRDVLYNTQHIIINWNYLDYSTMAGLRFRNVQIPQNAIITSAYSSHYRYSASYGDDANCLIYGDNVDNSGIIVGGMSLKDRTLTTANVYWQQNDLGSSWAESPDLSNIIQEIVNRPGWSIGNNIAIIFKGNIQPTDLYGICDYSYQDHTKAAKLFITYVTDVTIWELQETFTNVTPGTNIVWDKFQKATEFNTTYWWSVNATDGTTWTNETFSFKTREKYIPSPPSGFTATSINSNQINLAWTKANKADYTRIQRKTDGFPISISDGVNVYDDTGSSYLDFNNIAEGTTYYYSAWSYNVTDNAWSESFTSVYNKTNTKPMISNPVPESGSSGVSILPFLNITVNDIDADLMTINWYWNNGSSWELFGTNASVENGTYHQINANFSEYSKVYWWQVIVYDGKDTNFSEEFYFTINNLPIISNPYPVNNSIGISLNPLMNISVVDSDGDSMDIKWYYSNSSGSWELFGKNSNIGNGKYHQTNTNFSSYNTTYYWYVEVSDGKSTNSSPIFKFTTNNKPIITSPVPENESIDIVLRPNMNITIDDADGDLLTIQWFSNTSGSWKLFEKNTSVANGTYHQVNTNFSRYNTTYYWYVSVSDGKDTTTSDIYHFTTILNKKPEIDGEGPVNNSNNIKTVPVLNITVDDPNKDILDVFWYSNSTGSWVLFAKNLSIDPKDNPINISQVNSNFTKYNTTYWWSVNVSDGTDWTNKTYSFTTKENVLPLIYGENPENGSGNIKIRPTLNVTVNDVDQDTLYVYWFSNTSGPWEQFAENPEVSTASGEVNLSATNINFNKYNTTYWWNISCFDGTDWVNKTFYFTTKENDEPVIISQTPTDGSINLSIVPQLNIELYDPDGDILDIYWYSNSSGPWVLFGTNTSIENTSISLNVTKINTNFSKYNTTYCWSVNVSDGTDWVNETYSFTTKINNPPIISEPVPFEGQSGVCIPLESLGINISDPDGDAMNVTVKTNESGSWVSFDNLTDIVNGTYTFTDTSWASQYCTKYFWSVNVTDGTTWTNETFDFTTNCKPIISGVFPINGSTNVDPKPICNVTVADSDDDALDVYFYENSTTLYSSFNSKITYDEDDAYYLGGMQNNQIWVVINSDSANPMAGLRFRNVQIPQGATITNATLKVWVYSSSFSSPDFLFYGHNVDDSPAIEGSSGQDELINRALTTSYVQWVDQNIGSGWKTGPDISSIIQEIVDRPGWKIGNNITIITKDVQNTKRFSINDYQIDNGATAAELNIDFNESPWILQTNSSVGSNSSVVWDKYNNASSFNTTYWWAVHVHDGCSWTNETYHFTTRSAFIPDPPLNLTASANDKNIITLNWTNNGNNTYIEWKENVSSWAQGQGTFLINTDSLTHYTHLNRDNDKTYYYQAWGYNTTDKSFSLTYLSANAKAYGNSIPDFSNQIPENGLKNIDVNYPQVSIYISDKNGDTFNWTIQGKYVNDNSSNNDSNGTKTAFLLTPLPYDTEIVWYINVTDGFGWTNETYSFTTREQYIPVAPTNFIATTHNKTQIDLSWKNNEGNNTYIECNTIESWQLGEGQNLENSSTNTTYNHKNLDPNTKYFYQAWSYNISDNVYNDTFISTNATTNHAPNLGVPSPHHGAVNQPLSFIWSILITDYDNDTFNWTIECNNSQHNFSINDINGTKQITLTNLTYNTIYHIWVNVTDGYEWSNATYNFTTKDRHPSPPSSLNAYVQGKNRIDLTWDKGDYADKTYICYKIGTPPNNRNEGTELYNYTGTSESATSLLAGRQYGFSAWSWNDTEKTWSLSFVSCIAKTEDEDTPFIPPPPSGDPPLSDNIPPTTPTNVRCTTPETDNKPSFTWSASTDASGIKGYHVKIGSGAETSIGDKLTWTVADPLEDGTYTFYVRAEDINSNKGTYGSCTFTIKTTTSGIRPVANAGGPYYGMTFKPIQFDGSRSYDPDGSIVSGIWDFGNGTTATGTKPIHTFTEAGVFNITLTVTDDDGLTNTDMSTVTVLLDSDADGYPDDMELSYLTDPFDPDSFPLDTDKDGIPDDTSPDKKYLGDFDDDGDGLRDDYEKLLGSDPKDSSDVIAIKINNSMYFLVDITGNGRKDLFFDPETEISTKLGQGKNEYYIDMNNDGKWDKTYNLITQEISAYVESPSKVQPAGSLFFNILIVIIIIIISAVLIVGYLFKIGYLYIEYYPDTDKKRKNNKK